MPFDKKIEEMSLEEIVNEIGSCVDQRREATERIHALLGRLSDLKHLDDLKDDVEKAGIILNDDGGWGVIEYTMAGDKIK
jgi:hypothetical protein